MQNGNLLSINQIIDQIGAKKLGETSRSQNNVSADYAANIPYQDSNVVDEQFQYYDDMAMTEGAGSAETPTSNRKQRFMTKKKKKDEQILNALQ